MDITEYNNYKIGDLIQVICDFNSTKIKQETDDYHLSFTPTIGVHKLCNAIFTITKIKQEREQLTIIVTDHETDIEICYDTLNSKVPLSDILIKHYTFSQVIQLLQNNDTLKFRSSDNDFNILSINDYNELRFINCDWNNNTKKYEYTNILDELNINNTFTIVRDKEITFTQAMEKLRSGKCENVMLIYEGEDKYISVDEDSEGTYFSDEYGSCVLSIEEILDGKWFINEMYENEEEE